MSDLKTSAGVFLAVAICLAGGPLWAQEAGEESEQSSPTAVEASESDETGADGEPAKKQREGGVPEGGWLTDPAMIEKERNEALLNRIFPLWKSIAGDHPLPRPWSIGLVSYWQVQDFNFKSGSIKVGELPEIELDLSQVVATIDTKTVGVKGGLWLLPFFNITGTVGYTTTDSSINLIGIPVDIQPPRPGNPGPEITYGEKLLELEFTGPYYAVSGTIVGGWKRFFGSLTYSYARAEVEGSVSALSELTITTERVFPKFGYSFKGTSVWFGAQWNEEETYQRGELEDGFFKYDIVITKADWTPTVGMHTILGEHFEMTVEGGFGDRTSAMWMLGYRF